MSELLDTLARSTGLDEATLKRIISKGPRRYKTYTIPKRSGGRRLVSQPARELKALQRALIRNYLSKRPVHPSATAYTKGSSIRLNAAKHAENGPILKLDLRDFFPSIRSSDWLKYCERHEIFASHDDALMSCKILFKHTPGSAVLRLAIGAPSSPMLSNILMYDFDRLVAEKVGSDFVTYTRYADDLTFSVQRTGFLVDVERTVRKCLRQLEFPTLYINDEKTVLATTKYRREVTGLILTNDGRVSLGRERKRLLRAQIHHFKTGKLQPSRASHLAGMLAFAMDVEPEFVQRMQRVFSKDTIAAILSSMNSQDGE